MLDATVEIFGFVICTVKVSRVTGLGASTFDGEIMLKFVVIFGVVEDIDTVMIVKVGKPFGGILLFNDVMIVDVGKPFGGKLAFDCIIVLEISIILFDGTSIFDVVKRLWVIEIIFVVVVVTKTVGIELIGESGVGEKGSIVERGTAFEFTFEADSIIELPEVDIRVGIELDAEVIKMLDT